MYQRAIRSATENTSITYHIQNQFQEVLKMKFTKIISLLLIAVLGIGALASCANVDDGNTAAFDKEALTYVSLRINPEIELLAKG